MKIALEGRIEGKKTAGRQRMMLWIGCLIKRASGKCDGACAR